MVAVVEGVAVTEPSVSGVRVPPGMGDTVGSCAVTVLAVTAI
jgi:hypothetical protein